MVKYYLHIVVSLLIGVSIILGGTSFALNLPTSLTINQDMSDQALALAQQQFTTLRQQLTAIAKNMPPDQQAMIETAITMIEERLNRLDRIEVYFATENSPGEAYDVIYNSFKGQLSSFQEVRNDEIQFAVTQIPPGLIPQSTLDSLIPLINDGKVRAASGTSGKSRVSILTVYLNPQTFELIEGTTVVIAVDK